MRVLSYPQITWRTKYYKYKGQLKHQNVKFQNQLNSQIANFKMFNCTILNDKEAPKSLYYIKNPNLRIRLGLKNL